jgi:hypothetical protein
MIRVTTDVFCDLCGNWIHGGVYLKEARKVARKKSREAGWITRKSGGKTVDLCPGCQDVVLVTDVPSQEP